MNTTEVLKLVSEDSVTACTTRSSGNDIVSLDSFAKLTGFPSELIKKELLISGEQVSMKELRSSMMKYLMKTISE